MICKNCGKEYSIPEHFEIDSLGQLILQMYFNNGVCSELCYIKQLSKTTDFNVSKDEIENLINKFNVIGCTSFQMPIGDIHVYCTNCKHFRLDDEEIPYCPYEEKECDIRDCEDSRPFRERPMYEEGG
jgi:hypothetical protein